MRSLAFRLGRQIGNHCLASRLFCVIEPALPLQRMGRSAHCVAFDHPRPSYDPHILIVPTTPFPTLATLGMERQAKAALLWEMLQLAREVIAHRQGFDWQLIVNGGTRQEIGQVHGHLVHQREIARADGLFELTDPSEDFAMWNRLFGSLDNATSRPGNGFSVIVDLTKDGPGAAWITQTVSG